VTTSSSTYTEPQAIERNRTQGHLEKDGTSGTKRQQSITQDGIQERRNNLIRAIYREGNELEDQDIRFLYVEGNFQLITSGGNRWGLTSDQFAEMCKYYMDNIHTDGGNVFFGTFLGFNGYLNVVLSSSGYDGDIQIQHVQRVQLDYDMNRCKVGVTGVPKTCIPHFHKFFDSVNQYALSEYGQEILYFDLLFQSKESLTVYKFHRDNDLDNNPGDADIYRTIIVKITQGEAVSVQVAGRHVEKYGDPAGSFVEFRADAVHRSVMPSSSSFQSNVKIVFFVGHKDKKNDGRHFEEM